MSILPLQEVLASLESGARPAGGVSADSGEVVSIGGEHLSSDGGFNFTNIKRIPRSFFESMRGGRIARHDILVVKDGATTGKTSFVHEDFPFEKAAVNEHVFCVRVDQAKASSKYVFHFLRSPLGQKAINLDFRGATVGGISREFANKVRLPLPPLSEQRRIAEILDKADALQAKRRAALAQLDTLTQSIFLDMFGDPIVNSLGWPGKSLGLLGTVDRGVSKHRPRNAPELLGGPYPFVQTGNVANCDGYIREFTNTYSEAGLRQSRMWPAGTLCITIAANIAKTGILMFDACFPDSVVGFRSDDPATVEFVRTWLSFLQASLEDRAPESAQKNINLEILRSLSVPTPDVELRRHFARRVAVVERLKAPHRASLTELDALFTSLQHRAFRGEL